MLRQAGSSGCKQLSEGEWPFLVRNGKVLMQKFSWSLGCPHISYTATQPVQEPGPVLGCSEVVGGALRMQG